MRSLLPARPGEVEPYDFYRPAEPRAPWLRVNMVASVDGRVTDRDGVSGGLGSAGDLAAFRAQRALADAILVGAGTVRAENYGPHRIHRSVAQRRRADGRERPASIVVVSMSLDLDPGSPLFAEAAVPTIVITSASSSPERRERLSAVGEVIVAGDGRVDLTCGLAQLRSRGLAHLLCEGGPILNTALLQAGLVDELCLTLAPRLMDGRGKRIVEDSAVPAPTVPAVPTGSTTLALTGLGEHGDEVFLRYRIGSPDVQ
jgi:riboflavin-specific deaminase-like protein